MISKDSMAQTDIYADCQKVRAFYPLISSQKIVMDIYLSAPWSDVFNMPYLCTFPFDAAVERIRKALLTVFAHYPVLSVKVVEQDGIYGMVQCPERKLDIPVLDIGEDEHAHKKVEFVIPFRPEDDLFIRSVIYRTEKQIYLFWDTYHMVMDGTSMPLFCKQFARAYQGEALVPEPFTQFHLSNCEQKFRQSKLFQEAKEATVIERLQKLQADFIESLSYDYFPFELLEREYGVTPSIMCIYQGEIFGGFHLPEQFISLESLAKKSTFGLLVCTLKHDNNYELLLKYNMLEYEKSTMDKFLDIYVQTMNQFLSSLE